MRRTAAWSAVNDICIWISDSSMWRPMFGCLRADRCSAWAISVVRIVFCAEVRYWWDDYILTDMCGGDDRLAARLTNNGIVLIERNTPTNGQEHSTTGASAALIHSNPSRETNRFVLLRQRGLPPVADPQATRRALCVQGHCARTQSGGFRLWRPRRLQFPPPGP